MKNQTIRERYAALLALSDRVLPSAAARNKVASLLETRFLSAYNATETQRKQIIRDHAVPEGWDKDYLPPSVAEARQKAIDDMLAESQPIRAVPETMRLTLADMPKKLERKDGADNEAGLANIRVMLGGLYRKTGDEVFEDDTESGEEPE